MNYLGQRGAVVIVGNMLIVKHGKELFPGQKASVKIRCTVYGV